MWCEVGVWGLLLRREWMDRGGTRGPAAADPAEGLGDQPPWSV